METKKCFKCDYESMVKYDDDDDKKFFNTSKKCAVISGIVAFVFWIAFILTPSTKEAFVIYGVRETIEYLKDNETAKELPDKCIEALDKFVDEYMNEENERK